MSDATCPHLSELGQLRFFVLDEVDRMVEQGKFRELQSILRLMDNDTTGGKSTSQADGAQGSAPEAATTAGTADDGDGAEGGHDGVRRQTFLFSATLMLPPKAREANAKKLAKHKATSTDSTMDKLLYAHLAPRVTRRHVCTHV